MSEPKPEQRKSRSGPSSGSFKVARVEVQELAALAGPEVLSTAGADLLSDELLVDRILRGEPAHYDALMRRTAARLYRIARGIVGGPQRAQEVVQSAFVRAYENLGTYDRRLRFGDWLSRIAIHGALARLRRVSQPPPAAHARRRQLELVRQLEDAVDARCSARTAARLGFSRAPARAPPARHALRRRRAAGVWPGSGRRGFGFSKRTRTPGPGLSRERPGAQR
jgi:DNA-directed RNA polymerase specialized sigma24 family protein